MTQLLTGADAQLTPAQLAALRALQQPRIPMGEKRERYALRRYLKAAFEDKLATFALSNGYSASGVLVNIMLDGSGDATYVDAQGQLHKKQYGPMDLSARSDQMCKEILRPLGSTQVGYQLAVNYVNAAYRSMHLHAPGGLTGGL